jgi:hypothetical protein
LMRLKLWSTQVLEESLLLEAIRKQWVHEVMRLFKNFPKFIYKSVVHRSR